MTFITTTELGDYLGRDLSTDNGATLAVEMASQTVATLTEQELAEVIGDTAILDGTGTDTVLLPEVPVTNAGTVVLNGGTLDSNQYTVTANGELVRTSGTAQWWTVGWGRWGAWPNVSWTPYWPQGRQNITVTYDHGYAGTIPQDLRMVVLSLASRLVIQGVATAESVGMSSITYGMNATDLTNGEMRIIQKHRQRA